MVQSKLIIEYYQSIFDHEYFFHGIHADRLVALTSQFGKSASMKLLQRNVDVFMIAPVIGFIYGKRAALDNSQPDRTINFAQMTYYKSDLIFNYRLVILLDKDYEPDPQKRLDKAFRFMGTPQAEPDEKRFEEYMRGGIDVLYEKLVEGDSTPEAFANRLYEFIDEFNDRFNSEISSDDILQLCVNKS